jgi:elongator complex protein 3
MIPIGGEDADAYQHRGLGAKLLLEAEQKAAEIYNRRKILVTSAIGTREYYRALGYSREGPYMCKKLRA